MELKLDSLEECEKHILKKKNEKLELKLDSLEEREAGLLAFIRRHDGGYKSESVTDA